MRYILFSLIILFVSFSDLFLFRMHIIPFSPANFLVPVFLLFSVVTFHVNNYFKYLRTHTFVYFLLYFLISVFYGLNSIVDSAEVQTAMVLSLITLLIYSFCLILFIKSSEKEIRLFLLIGLSVMAASIWYDMFLGLPTKNLELIGSARKGGFAENPNVAASSVKFLGLGLLFLYRKVKTMRTIVLALTFSSVFLTFSRSGLISVLMIIILLILNEWKVYFNLKINRLILTGMKTIIILGVFYSLLLVFADVIRQEVPAFREGDASDRLDFLTGQSKADLVSKDDNSNYGRKTLVIRYLDDFYSNPFGLGTGYCSDKKINFKNTHNFYLRTAVEFGIIGLLIFIVFLVKSIKLAFTSDNFYYFVFILLILFECLISHFLFQEKPIIIVLALMDANLYFKNRKANTKQNFEPTTIQ